MDAALGHSCSRNEVIRYIHLGSLCAQGDTEERPCMISIVSYLNSDHVLLALQQSTDLMINSRRVTSSGTLQVSDGSNKTGSSLRASELHSYKSTNESTHPLDLWD